MTLFQSDRIHGQLAELVHRAPIGPNRDAITSWARSLEDQLMLARRGNRRLATQEALLGLFDRRLAQRFTKGMREDALEAYVIATLAIKGIADARLTLAAAAYTAPEQASSIRRDFSGPNGKETLKLRMTGTANSGSIAEKLDEEFEALRPFYQFHRNSVAHGDARRSLVRDGAQLIVAPHAVPGYITDNQYVTPHEVIRTTLDRVLDTTEEVFDLILSDTHSTLKPTSANSRKERRKHSFTRAKRYVQRTLICAAAVLLGWNQLTIRAEKERYNAWYTAAVAQQSQFHYSDDIVTPHDPLSEQWGRQDMTARERGFLDDYLNKLPRADREKLIQVYAAHSIAFDTARLPKFTPEVLEQKEKEVNKGLAGTPYDGVAGKIAAGRWKEDLIRGKLDAITQATYYRLEADIMVQFEKTVKDGLAFVLTERAERDPIIADIVRAAALTTYSLTGKPVSNDTLGAWFKATVEVADSAQRTTFLRDNTSGRMLAGERISVSFKDELHAAARKIVPGNEERFWYFLKNHTLFYENVRKSLQLTPCSDLWCRDGALVGEVNRVEGEYPKQNRQYPLHLVKTMPLIPSIGVLEHMENNSGSEYIHAAQKGKQQKK